jgi:hypothetical protein
MPAQTDSQRAARQRPAISRLASDAAKKQASPRRRIHGGGSEASMRYSVEAETATDDASSAAPRTHRSNWRATLAGTLVGLLIVLVHEVAHGAPGHGGGRASYARDGCSRCSSALLRAGVTQRCGSLSQGRGSQAQFGRLRPSHSFDRKAWLPSQPAGESFDTRSSSVMRRPAMPSLTRQPWIRSRT